MPNDPQGQQQGQQQDLQRQLDDVERRLKDSPDDQSLQSQREQLKKQMAQAGGQSKDQQ